MDVFFVLASLQCHISFQIPISQLQQPVILLKLALVFLEQFVVQILVIYRRIVHGYVQGGHVNLLVVGLVQILQVFSY